MGVVDDHVGHSAELVFFTLADLILSLVIAPRLALFLRCGGSGMGRAVARKLYSNIPGLTV